jgi:hypothetical protein
VSFTYQAMIEAALSQACAGTDPLTNPISDTSWIAEDFVSSIFQQVGAECAKDEHKRSLLRRVKTVTFINGAATLTSDVLTEYKEDSTLYDASDMTKEYSLVREWGDFIQPRIGWMLWQGIYSMNGVTISVVEPNANYDPTAGVSADRILVIPCVPTVPASASTVVDVPSEIENDLIEGLATALRGVIQNDNSAKTND